jgi:hypothetical protein
MNTTAKRRALNASLLLVVFLSAALLFLAFTKRDLSTGATVALAGLGGACVLLAVRLSRKVDRMKGEHPPPK